VFIGDARSKFRLYAGSRRALNVLGLEGGILAQEHISAASFFPAIVPDYSTQSRALSIAELRAIASQADVADLNELLRRPKSRRRSQASRKRSSQKLAKDDRYRVGNVAKMTGSKQAWDEDSRSSSDKYANKSGSRSYKSMQPTEAPERKSSQ